MNDLDPEQMSLVDQAIRSRRAVPVPPGPPKTAIRAVQAAGAASFHPVRGTVLERIMHMDRRIRLSAAAIFLSVTGLAVWMLLSGGTSVGWADVLERIKQTRTLTCTMTERTTGTAKLFVKEPCQRIELSDGNIVIWNRITGKQVVLRPTQHEATLSQLAEQSFDFYGWVRDVHTGQEKPLGEKNIAGRRTQGFQLTRSLLGQPDAAYTFWIDPATKLPIQIETGAPDGKEPAILTDIRFDVPLEDALFDMAIPAGYRVHDLGGIASSQLRAPPTTQQADAMTITPLVGIGPLRFGATKEQVIAFLGQPEGTASNTLDMRYPSKGLALMVHPKAGLLSIACMTRASVGGLFALNDFAGRTDKGIAMGATRADIEAAYGKKATVTGTGPQAVLEYKELKGSFYLMDDHLVRMSFMKSPSAPQQ